MSAADFLQYMIKTLHVDFVRNEAVPGPVLAMFQEKLRQQNQNFAAQTPPGRPVFQVTRFETANAIVRYNINTIPVEEWLNVTVTCNDSPQPLIPSGWGHAHTCTGSVIRERTRQGNLEALMPVFRAISDSTTLNQPWSQQWTAAIQAAGQAVRASGQAAEAQLQRAHAQQMEAQEMRNQQHQEMMNVTRQGTERAIQGAKDGMDARSGIAHDWADYALDQQKRMDPNTGEITKDSSAYSYTWVDQFGTRQQSNDINYNPNGMLKGNWTLQTNVR